MLELYSSKPIVPQSIRHPPYEAFISGVGGSEGESEEGEEEEEEEEQNDGEEDERGGRWGGARSAPYAFIDLIPLGRRGRGEEGGVEGRVYGKRGGEGGVEVMVGVRVRRGGSPPAGPPLAHSYSGPTA